VIGRFIRWRWRAAANARDVRTEQTVMVVTITNADPVRGRSVAARLRSVLRHPSAQGLVTYTEEDFPQAPHAPPDGR
jgi:hypothetical protein